MFEYTDEKSLTKGTKGKLAMPCCVSGFFNQLCFSYFARSPRNSAKSILVLISGFRDFFVFFSHPLIDIYFDRSNLSLKIWPVKLI